VNTEILDLDNMIAPDNEVQNMKCATPANLYYTDGKYICDMHFDLLSIKSHQTCTHGTLTYGRISPG